MCFKAYMEVAASTAELKNHSKRDTEETNAKQYA